MMRRLRRRHLCLRRAGDEGASLVFALIITMLVFTFTMGVSQSTLGQIKPSTDSRDIAIAIAAAEAGIADFAAKANFNCANPGRCVWMDANPKASQTAVTTSAGSPTFAWRITNATSYMDNGYARIVSTGRTTGTHPVSRTLVADFTTASPDTTDYLYQSKFETVSSSLIYSKYPARKIVIDNPAALSAIGQSGTSQTATWGSAPKGTGIDPLIAGSPEICDRYWYTDPAVGQGRAFTLKSYDHNEDWAQVGSIGSTAYTNYGKCEVTFGRGESFDGPVYSLDALLLSNTIPGQSTGPTFTDKVQTYWGVSGHGQNPTPGDVTSPWRSDLYVGGKASGNQPVSYAVKNEVQNDLTNMTTTNRCEYSGPTRVRLLGNGFAVVTSPLTPASATNPCFKNDPTVSYSGLGVFDAVIPVLDTTAVNPLNRVGYVIYAKDYVGTSPTPGALFKYTTTIAPTPSAANTSTGQTASSGWPGSPNASETALRTAIDSKISANPSQALSTNMQSALTAAYTNPPSSNGNFRYTYVAPEVTDPPTTSATARTTTGSVSGPAVDPLLEPTTGTATFTEQKTDTTYHDSIKQEEYGCQSGGNYVGQPTLGLCLLSSPGWGFVKNLTLASTKSTYGWGSASTMSPSNGGTSVFPISGDITNYSQTNGDLYVEGTLKGNASFVADHDIVVTGNLNLSDATADAMDLVAVRNVRIYHPVKCTDTNAASLAATVVVDGSANPLAGFCPNDITGLYPSTAVPDWSVHPSQQYADILPKAGILDPGTGNPVNLDTINLSAIIYALNGSFYTDNYDRGRDGSATARKVDVHGGVHQTHRGAVGVKWEIAPNGTVRHATGYEIAYHYDGGRKGRVIPFIPVNRQTTFDHTWKLAAQSTSNSLIAS